MAHLKTYSISIGQVELNIRSIDAYGQSSSDSIRIFEICRGAIQKAASFAVARSAALLERYEQYLKDKHKEYMAQWPPHSIMCEKRCCQKAFKSYHRYLKKAIQWGPDGHLI